MPNKSDRQDIHEQLVEKMRMAGVESQKQDSYRPSFDWSFKEHKAERKSSGRFMRVAAIIIILLLGMNIVVLSLPQTVSYSDQSILHRLYTGVTGLFTDSENDVDINDVKFTMETDKWDNIKKFKRKIKQLYIPEYIPEGYVFSEFYAEEYYSGNYMGYYSFTDGLQIVFNYYDNPDNVYSDTRQGELIELEDRVLYITVDEIEMKSYVTVITDDGVMDISGSCSKDEMIKIACNLIK